MSNAGNEHFDQELPTSFPVAVIMQCRESAGQWQDYEWQALGVVVGGLHVAANNSDAMLLRKDDGVEQFVYGGLEAMLYVDECESYYHNLLAKTPRCYVIARRDEDAVPVPFLVSLSFDEAHAYLEADDEVFEVDMPPEIYRWTEAFVLHHYTPEKRVKRKRQNWRGEAGNGGGV